MLETPARIEPARLDETSEAINDVVAELTRASAVLGAGLHPRTAASLAALMRTMNAYYSNLIEGHVTRPRDIERALAGELDVGKERRDLQLEAASHVRVQADVDALAAAHRLPEPASMEFLKTLHRAFYKDVPSDMLRLSGHDGGIAIMRPGEWRAHARHDVAVGRHIPPSSAVVPSFMRYFEERYRIAPLGAASRITAMAAAHHRLNYIHPFPDGNGRVSRLMSHAMAHAAGIGAGGLWSISRGLARGLENRNDYKRMMDHADMPRQGDLDGRGNLSQRALSDFVLWFLSVALDQVLFMSSLLDLGTLSGRLHAYARSSTHLRPEAGRLLEEALVRGEVRRGDVARIAGVSERTGRRLLADLQAEGLLASDAPKGAVSLRFPAATLDVLFPRLVGDS